jgi:hypothetical protein
VFGISKQAYYKRIKTAKQKEMQATIIKKMIEPIRNKCHAMANNNEKLKDVYSRTDQSSSFKSKKRSRFSGLRSGNKTIRCNGV